MKAKDTPQPQDTTQNLSQQQGYQYANQRRRVSTIIFVNGEEQTGASHSTDIDRYQGGALMFYGLLKDEKATKFGLSLDGQPGLLIAFDSGVMHEVKPVTAGERLTIVNWFLGEEVERSS